VTSRETLIDGPYFEDLQRGQRFGDSPSLTLTDGLAAAHQAIVGCRLPLALDRDLAARVIGKEDPPAPDGEHAALAAPNLVWDVAIGQSTSATHTVRANLFYRGVVFRRAPRIGDTLRTVTEVVGLRQNSPKPGRPATGLVALRISSRDARDRPVLDFWRCAMLPLRDSELETGQADDLSAVGTEPQAGELAQVAAGWDLDAYRHRAPGHPGDPAPGQVFRVAGGDVVSSAPELARLTLNVAKIHHDATAGSSGRLVYGGHTIGIALHQAVRALPAIVTVVGWHGCDHTGPVREGDTLTSTVEVERVEPAAAGGRLAHLRSLVQAHRPGEPAADVLDWRFVALLAR
jgi:acyl dehydratase